jgi:hypothetical protein
MQPRKTLTATHPPLRVAVVSHQTVSPSVFVRSSAPRLRIVARGQIDLGACVHSVSTWPVGAGQRARFGLVTRRAKAGARG